MAGGEETVNIYHETVPREARAFTLERKRPGGRVT